MLQQRMATHATLERFVVYHQQELVTLGRAPLHSSESTGNCSSCYKAQANLKVELKILMVWNRWKQRVKALVVEALLE